MSLMIALMTRKRLALNPRFGAVVINTNKRYLEQTGELPRCDRLRFPGRSHRVSPSVCFEVPA